MIAVLWLTTLIFFAGQVFEIHGLPGMCPARSASQRIRRLAEVQLFGGEISPLDSGKAMSCLGMCHHWVSRSGKERAKLRVCYQDVGWLDSEFSKYLQCRDDQLGHSTFPKMLLRQDEETSARRLGICFFTQAVVIKDRWQDWDAQLPFWSPNLCLFFLGVVDWKSLILQFFAKYGNGNRIILRLWNWNLWSWRQGG